MSDSLCEQEKAIPVRLYNRRTCQLGKKGETGRPEPKYTETQTSQKKHRDNNRKQTSPVTLINRLSSKAPLPGRST